MSDTLLIILSLATVGAVALFSYLIFLIKKIKMVDDEDESKGIKLLFQQVNDLKNSVNDSLSKQERALLEKFSVQDKTLHNQTRSLTENQQKMFAESSKLIESVTKKLTELDSTNKQVVGFAEQMQSLENILKNPKQRGVLGEYFLDSLLGSVLAPTQYQMQYKFPNGEIVDAAIFIQEQIIPIDSKFSLENFNQMMQTVDPKKRAKLEQDFRADVKKRIDETSKYVRPEQNTMEFSFMYVPAEGVYHALLVNTVGTTVNMQNLMEYAFSKKVIIVSPSSFLAYLQTVMQGLKQLKMEEGFKEIQKNVIKLGKHILSFDEKMQKMGNHLGTTVSMFNQSYKEFKKIDKDVYKISEESIGGDIEVMELEKPQQTV
ncbi:MAG: DNA recombination protein RmuC [Candidatus Gracilibacteria bacterium]|nr:DNA recombination protein RmuC [Candidatus Gracilibacteria bacterium]